MQRAHGASPDKWRNKVSARLRWESVEAGVPKEGPQWGLGARAGIEPAGQRHERWWVPHPPRNENSPTERGGAAESLLDSAKPSTLFGTPLPLHAALLRYGEHLRGVDGLDLVIKERELNLGVALDGEELHLGGGC